MLRLYDLIPAIACTEIDYELPVVITECSLRCSKGGEKAEGGMCRVVPSRFVSVYFLMQHQQ